jgi:hypothetical protein
VHKRRHKLDQDAGFKIDNSRRGHSHRGKIDGGSGLLERGLQFCYFNLCKRAFIKEKRRYYGGIMKKSLKELINGIMTGLTTVTV